MPNPRLPEEDEIENLLRRITPLPTVRLQQRMRAAPWHSSGRRAVRHSSRRLVWALVVLLIAILAGAIAFIPPIQAVARQIIYSFFPASSNQVEVQVTPSSSGDLFNFNDPSNFTLSPAEASRQAGFPLRQISPLPQGLTLVGAHFDAGYQAVILMYQGDNFSLFLTQRPLGKGQDVFSIGAAAQVEQVLVAGTTGEIVQGGWKAVSTQVPPETQIPSSPVSITAIWDNQLPQLTLRWQAGSVAYELRSLGEEGPSRAELINWANGLK